MVNLPNNKLNRFFNSTAFFWVVVFGLATAGLAIRLYDLTDLPLDFAPTRQLFSAIKARGMYAAMLPVEQQNGYTELAISQWKGAQAIEPTIIEGLIALTYLFTGELLWVGRLYSAIFWVLGGIPIVLLSKKISNKAGSLVSLGVYLFLPYGIIASRAIQPDPLMVCLVAFAVWANFEWVESKGWKWAILAGLFNGAAMLVKNVAVFPLFFCILALIGISGLFESLRNRQTWVVILLSILPVAAYSLYGIFAAGFLGQQFAFRFFPNLWSDPVFYLRWKNQVDGVIGFSLALVAFLSMLSADQRGRRLLAGLWIGYLAYGFTFAYHITSHDYYQLPLVMITALSLAPLAEHTSKQIGQKGAPAFAYSLLGGAMLFAVFVSLWTARVDLARTDYRPEVARWQAIGKVIGSPSKVLTISEDYGYRLAYWGQQDVEAWLDDADLNLRELDGREINIMQKFAEKVAGKQYIVITQLGKLDNQPEVKDFIEDTYPVFAQGEGFIIYDVQGQIK